MIILIWLHIRYFTTQASIMSEGCSLKSKALNGSFPLFAGGSSESPRWSGIVKCSPCFRIYGILPCDGLIEVGSTA